MPGSGTAGSYEDSIFSFLRSLHTIFIVAASIYMPTNTFLYSRSEHNFVNQLYFVKIKFFLFLVPPGRLFPTLAELASSPAPQGSFPMAQQVKNLTANAGDPGSIPGLGRSPGEVKGYRHQYSCLENPMDRGSWWATGHGVAERRTRRKCQNTA